MGSLPLASRIASTEALDLVVLDEDLFGENFMEGIAESSSLFSFPRLILVAKRGSWGPGDDPEAWGCTAILWKPVDLDALYDKVSGPLHSARAE